MNKTEQTADKRVRVLQKHQYTIKEELGRGISGIVFLVDSIERNPYVIKEMNCRDDKDRKQIEAEVKNLRTLNHGYIVAYVDSFEDEETGLFYVVMEYCGGGDLHKRMEEQAKRNDVFEEEQILDWLVQMCLALQYLHANNVYHRDIKSQNVFLTKDGYLNLGDFGYSKTLESADVYAKSVVGADLYVSPEAMKKHYDSKRFYIYKRSTLVKTIT